MRLKVGIAQGRQQWWFYDVDRCLKMLMAELLNWPLFSLNWKLNLNWWLFQYIINRLQHNYERNKTTNINLLQHQPSQRLTVSKISHQHRYVRNDLLSVDTSLIIKWTCLNERRYNIGILISRPKVHSYTAIRVN